MFYSRRVSICLLEIHFSHIFYLYFSDTCLIGLEAILRNGEYVGHVRRGDHAYFINKEVAYGYVSKPGGGKITNAWLSEGNYQIESRGQLFDAAINLKTPFDSSNNRIQGHYESEDCLLHIQEQRLLDYKSMINNAVSVRCLHTYS